MQVQAASV